MTKISLMISMDDKTFAQYSSLIYAQSGITLGETKKELVRARLAKRMRILGISDYRDYYQYVIHDQTGQEMTLLLDVISTHVTSFFREKDHFQFLASVMKDWYAKGQRRFRFWSAGCSTGEEPVSLAITLLDSLPADRSLDLKILATDISRPALEIARKGRYEKAKVAHLSAQEAKYFRSIDQGYVEISDQLKKVLIFNYLNLQAEYPFQGPMDAIFCRNVMIYFDEKGRSEIIQRFYRVLRARGYLMVGHSESLLGMANGLQYVRPSIYQKQYNEAGWN